MSLFKSVVFKSSKNWWIIIVLVGIGFMAAIASNRILAEIALHSQGKVGIYFFYLITAFGALGGILYSTKNRFIEMPHDDVDDKNKVSLGFFADILGGIGGAYVIFLLLPFEFHQVARDEMGRFEANPLLNSFEQIRILFQVIAISLIGGYGGRALIEQVQTEILKKNVDKVVAETERNTLALENAMSTIKKLETERIRTEEEESRKNEVLRLNSRLLFDMEQTVSAHEKEKFIKLLGLVKPSIRQSIFYKAFSFREKYALELINLFSKEINPDDFNEAAYDAFYNANKAKLKSVAVAMEVVAFIFDALLKALHSESACTGSDEWKQEMTEFEHRYHAQLAYAKKDLLYCLNLQFKDQREWDDIIQHLTQAISRRPPKDIGTYEAGQFAYYELNKAVALIEHDGNYSKGQKTSYEKSAEIRRLLEAADAELKRHDASLRLIFPVNVWQRLNSDGSASSFS